MLEGISALEWLAIIVPGYSIAGLGVVVARNSKRSGFGFSLILVGSALFSFSFVGLPYLFRHGDSFEEYENALQRFSEFEQGLGSMEFVVASSMFFLLFTLGGVLTIAVAAFFAVVVDGG